MDQPRLKRAQWFRRLPLLTAVGCVAGYTAGSGDVALLTFAGIAILLQLVITLDTNGRRMSNWVCAIFIVALLVFIVVVPRSLRAFRDRHFTTKVIAVEEAMYWPGSSNDLTVAVSPDEKWLIYAVDSDRPSDWAPTIVLRELASDSGRTVDFSGIAPRRVEKNPGAVQVARYFESPCWTPSHVRFGNVNIELATGLARWSNQTRVECETREIRTSVDYQLYLQLENIDPARQEVIHPATDWSDSVPDPSIYFSRNVRHSRYSWEGRLERRWPDGSIEVLHRKRALTTPWTIHDPSVSPDGRFVAFEATSEPLWPKLIAAPLWLIYGVSAERSCLFVFDLHANSEHAIQSSSPCSFFWSVDSRRLYFINRDRIEDHNVSVVQIDIPPDPRAGLKTVRKVQPLPARRPNVGTIESSNNVIRIPSASNPGLIPRP